MTEGTKDHDRRIDRKSAFGRSSISCSIKRSNARKKMVTLFFTFKKASFPNNVPMTRRGTRLKYILKRFWLPFRGPLIEGPFRDLHTVQASLSNSTKSKNV